MLKNFVTSILPLSVFILLSSAAHAVDTSDSYEVQYSEINHGGGVSESNNFEIYDSLPPLADDVLSNSEYTLYEGSVGQYASIASTQCDAFSASPTSIITGQSSTLSWSLTDADTATISGIGSISVPTGSTVVSPTATTIYTLIAQRGSQQDQCTVTVQVADPSASCDSFVAVPSQITKGDSANLIWFTTGATSGSIDQGIGSVVVPNASKSVSPTVDTKYTLSLDNGFNITQCDAMVTVVDPPPVPSGGGSGGSGGGGGGSSGVGGTLGTSRVPLSQTTGNQQEQDDDEEDAEDDDQDELEETDGPFEEDSEFFDRLELAEDEIGELRGAAIEEDTGEEEQSVQKGRSKSSDYEKDDESGVYADTRGEDSLEDFSKGANDFEGTNMWSSIIAKQYSDQQAKQKKYFDNLLKSRKSKLHAGKWKGYSKKEKKSLPKRERDYHEVAYDTEDTDMEEGIDKEIDGELKESQSFDGTLSKLLLLLLILLLLLMLFIRQQIVLIRRKEVKELKKGKKGQKKEQKNIRNKASSRSAKAIVYNTRQSKKTKAKKIGQGKKK